jgi:hypothetical protein
MARLARINGYADYCELGSILFPRQNSTTFVDIKFNFTEFCTSVGNAYGSVNYVMKELTNLNARLQLGEIDWDEFRDIENGKLAPPLGDLTFFGTTALNFCRACVKRDIAEYGFSYWHRLHQLPVMVCCPEHGEALFRFTCKRSRLHQSFPLPGDDLVQTNAREVTVPSLQPFWFDIAAVAEKLLGDRSEAFDSTTIREVLLDELRLKNLITATGRLRSVEFDTAFKRFHPHCPAKFNESTLESVETPKQLLRGLTDSAAALPFARVVLIQWLFGGWAAFKERCHWKSILGKPLETAAEKSDLGRMGNLPDETKLLAEYRLECVDYAIKNANPSRLDFLKTHYRCFRWLLHNDRIWLETQLPLPPRQVFQLPLFE